MRMSYCRIIEAIAEVESYIRLIKLGSQMSGKLTLMKDSKVLLEYCGKIHLHFLICTRQFRTWLSLWDPNITGQRLEICLYRVRLFVLKNIPCFFFKFFDSLSLAAFSLRSFIVAPTFKFTLVKPKFHVLVLLFEYFGMLIFG